MKILRTLAALLLAAAFTLTGCGAAEEDSTPDTEAEVLTESQVDTESESASEMETESKPQSYVTYEQLTVVGDPVFDHDTGMFIVKFSETKVRFDSSDECQIGIAGGGEAYSIPGTIDTETYPELKNGDYFTGVAVKPSDTLDGSREYTYVINFGMYSVRFKMAIGE